MRLGRHYRFCVGMGWESSTTIAAGQTTFKSSKQRAFVLIRAPIDWPKMVIVSEDQDGRVTVDQPVFGFLLLACCNGPALPGELGVGAFAFCSSVELPLLQPERFASWNYLA